MNYSNVHYDELIKKAKTDFVLDTENRWEALREAEQVLLEDLCGSAALSYWLSICTKGLCKRN